MIVLVVLLAGTGLVASGCGSDKLAEAARPAQRLDLGPAGQSQSDRRGAGGASRQGRVHGESMDAGLPRVAASGATVQALWQLRLVEPSVTGDTVVGATESRIDAVSALTGALHWSASMPAEPWLIRLSVAGSVVIAEAGRPLDDPAGTIVVKEVAVYSLRSGRALWHVAIPSSPRSYLPGVARAYADGVIVFAEPGGELIARRASTGVVVWRASRPRQCGSAHFEGASTDTRLAAGGGVLVASYACGGHDRQFVLVTRISPATGELIWRWRSSSIASGSSTSFLDLSVVAAASRGEIVLLQGQLSNGKAYARTLPHPRTWPTMLGPEGNEMLLALDGRDGHPRWSELGGQYPELTLADDAVCEYHTQGVECREDPTGAPAGPVLSSGLSELGSGTAFRGDETAGVAGDLVAYTRKHAAGGPLLIELSPVHGQARTGRVLVWLGPNLPEPANSAPSVVRAATLPGGATLLLVRRLDVAGDPLLALGVRLR